MKALRNVEAVCYAALITCAALLLQGCNAAKKVMRNKQDFDKVGEAWSKEHPCVNDTLPVFLPGLTTSHIGDYELDTTPMLPGLQDSGLKSVRTFTRKVYFTRRDTIRYTVKDTRAEAVLQKEMARLRDSLTTTTINKNYYKSSRNSWRSIVYAICGTITLAVLGLFLFFSYFKKFTRAHTALSKQIN